jgi:DNA-binding NarL/FixJ family response regulator
MLIADDQPRARHSLKTLLQAMTTCEDCPLAVEVVAEAQDGQEAVRIAELVHPDVVVMDVRMPVMDGLDAARLIRQNQPHAKIILLSIYEAYRYQALNAGADAYWIKGSPFADLLAAICEPFSLATS